MPIPIKVFADGKAAILKAAARVNVPTFSQDAWARSDRRERPAKVGRAAENAANEIENAVAEADCPSKSRETISFTEGLSSR